MRRWWLSTEFLRSGEFTIAYVAGLVTILNVGVLPFCFRHVINGNIIVGCSLTTATISLILISGGKFVITMRRARHKYTMKEERGVGLDLLPP
ncbi:MAG: hypothetical protein ABEI06_00905 [Halobacteriaceae archaeon]